MAALAGCFLDTSVILAGIIELNPDHLAPQTVMDAVADGRLTDPMTAWHCCLEFYSVATRLPHEVRVQPAQAALLIEQEIMPRFHVHALPRNRREPFWSAAASDRIVGGRIYDAHIAEIARQVGAKMVVTENRRHFVQLLRHGIAVVTASELVEQLPG